MNKKAKAPEGAAETQREDNKIALHLLKALYKEREKEKHPYFPDHARVVPAFSDSTANGLTKCVIEWLRLNGHQSERINTMGRPIDNRRTFTDVTGRTRQTGSVKWIPSGSQRGSADVSSTIMGQSIKIEIKAGRDRQSEAQKQYQQQVEAAGGVYLIVRNFTEFLQWYDEFTKGGTNVR